MKIFLGLFLLLLLVANSFGSPLIYSAKLDTQKSGGFVVLGEFDASKYKQVRVALMAYSDDVLTSIKYSSIIEGMEENDVITYQDLTGDRVTVVMDSPPSKIRFKVYGEGHWRVYVWGQ